MKRNIRREREVAFEILVFLHKAYKQTNFSFQFYPRGLKWVLYTSNVWNLTNDKFMTVVSKLSKFKKLDFTVDYLYCVTHQIKKEKIGDNFLFNNKLYNNGNREKIAI